MRYIRIYSRPILSTVDDYVHVMPARQYWRVDGPRLWRGRPDIALISGRYRIDADLLSALLCGKLFSCCTQCNLTCGIWIHWAAALNHTAIQRLARCLLQQPQLASTRWIDWTSGALARSRCESLLASAVWINRATQLCLVAELNIDLLELSARGECFVVHVVLFCVEHLN